MPVLENFQRASIALAVSQAICVSSLAATIEVDTINDVGGVSECALRDAITAAETDDTVAGCSAGDGADIIDLTALPDNSTITLASQLPTISSAISINGSGKDLLSISGAFQTRILNVTMGGDLNLNSLTLTQGSIFFDGGAINATSAAVSLDSVSITNSSASFSGGAINMSNGSLNITNSNISNNSTLHYGGGINASDSDIVVSNTVLSENSVTGPSILFGASYSGGGIRSRYGSVLISDSTFSGNSARQYGGALDSFFSSITIDDTTLSQNNTRNGGAIHSDGGTININKSTLSHNNADVNGAGVFAYRTFLNISNSTLSGNSASINGGGISSSFSTITIDHSTITENIADNVGSGIDTRDLSVIVSNSIVSGNTFGAREGAEVIVSSGASFSASNNILGFDELSNEAAFINFTPDATNIVATSDGLNLELNEIVNSLADNGGDTFTHSLPADSPAFNASNNVNCPPEDQRGEPRDDGFCDIGAFEGDSGLVLEDESFFVIPTKNGKAIIFQF